MTKAQTIVAELTSLYEGAVERLRTALTAFIKTGERPHPEVRANVREFIENQRLPWQERG